eukprot:CAMPEP_0171058280 /NCGR_PEP_ID=MMETSP0766_2-20121228/2410_1 /TAXON_ID=439317 /ORGANISM="Gambierdiscus australes, Strain CAWD 149" /LENGTH=62 /DNA_ID=CAMNT_0011513541 /DNA_START=464 /DNA_END=649 /DNA_ORIENTATION=+
MNSTFTLRGRAPELKAELTTVKPRTKVIRRLAAYVLHAVPEALHQIGHELVHRALVLHCPSH